MSSPQSIRRFERWALRCAVIFGAASLLLVPLAPDAIGAACRLAIFSCLAPAVGCTVFVLIHRVTGGQWTGSFAPFLRAGVALLPWIWLLAIPVLLACRRSYAPGLVYDGFALVAARAVLFAVVFFWLRWALAGGVGAEDDPRRNARPWAGPAGLIVLFFMLTFLADDWLESLEKDWHSTAFTVVWIAGQSVCALSSCILGGIGAGARPASKGSEKRPVGLDWGNLLLAAVMFWAYVEFAQFLIIWAGNLPGETSWYIRREHGAWGYALPAVALFGFAIPLFMLLSRSLKQSGVGLSWAALLVLVSQLGYTAWLILPGDLGTSMSGLLLACCVLAAAAALFSNRFVRAARSLGAPA